LIPLAQKPAPPMLDAKKSETVNRPQFILTTFLFICIVIGSAISLFIVNYNSIWGSVNEPEKYPKTWVILNQYRQFWFGAAGFALVAGVLVPRNYRNCLLTLFIIALAAGLYNWLLPLGML
jgi:hypothetical protein